MDLSRLPSGGRTHCSVAELAAQLCHPVSFVGSEGNGVSSGVFIPESVTAVGTHARPVPLLSLLTHRASCDILACGAPLTPQGSPAAPWVLCFQQTVNMGLRLFLWLRLLPCLLC